MQRGAHDRIGQAPGPDPRELPRLLTARELETMLHIDVKTIYSYVQRGLIPYVRIQSNVRFRREEIRAWIEAHSYTPVARNRRRSA